MSSTSQVRCFHSVIKNGVPYPYTPPRVIIKYNKSLLSLLTRFIFLGLLLKSLPPMTAKEVKHVSPILYFDGIIYFAVVSFCFNIDQYLFATTFSILPQKNVSAWPAKSKTHFSFTIFLQGNPQNTPTMDVVRLDTFLTLDNKI